MCLKNTYYPLVRLKDGKKKILFKYGVDVTGRDEFENLVFETTQWKLAKLHLSKHETLNRAFQEVEDLEEFEQMIQVPCGSCAECLKANSRSWAFRILQEASHYDDNYFITLTYDDEPNQRRILCFFR